MINVVLNGKANWAFLVKVQHSDQPHRSFALLRVFLVCIFRCATFFLFWRILFPARVYIYISLNNGSRRVVIAPVKKSAKRFIRCSGHSSSHSLFDFLQVAIFNHFLFFNCFFCASPINPNNPVFHPFTSRRCLLTTDSSLLIIIGFSWFNVHLCVTTESIFFPRNIID